ncbi:MAG: hypothetical protein QNJ84_13595 [Alphaproteobacteria bacterium]|nr:hypothetical protein [Alphaproteobacteria bacterium]
MAVSEIKRRRGGRAKALGVVFAASVALCGCDSDFYQDTPVLSGNTIDRFNDLAVTSPRSANVTISYTFGAVSQDPVTVPGGLPGPSWLFAEQGPDAPEAFLHVHLVAPAVGAPDASGTPVRIGKKRFQSILYCVDPSEGTPAAVAPYLARISASGFALSSDVFLRRYVAEEIGVDGRRIDVVYVRDIARLGLRCDGLGDLTNPEPDVKPQIDRLGQDAARAWEIVG